MTHIKTSQDDNKPCKQFLYTIISIKWYQMLNKKSKTIYKTSLRSYNYIWTNSIFILLEKYENCELSYCCTCICMFKHVLISKIYKFNFNKI